MHDGMYQPQRSIRPAKWVSPIVDTITDSGSRTFGRVTCWCGRVYYTADPARAQELADRHVTEHQRPSFWLRKLAEGLGHQLVRLGPPR